MRTFFYLIFGMSVLIGSCRTDINQRAEALYNLPAYTDNGHIQVVVEIPAGTNHKIEYQKDKKVFAVDQENGADRIIDFLPYPGNYGFVPSTLMDESRGGDGDALDVLVISESQPTGSVIESKLIAALLLEDEGEIDTKLIAIPVDSTQQVFEVRDFTDFAIRCSPAKYMIEQWFLHYKGLGKMQLIEWRDEKYARSEVEKWSKQRRRQE